MTLKICFGTRNVLFQVVERRHFWQCVKHFDLSKAGEDIHCTGSWKLATSP